MDRGADLIIAGDLTECRVTTSLSLSSWDAIGVVDLTLKCFSSSAPDAPITRRYQSGHVSETLLGPSKEEFEEVMRACLEDILRQMASDAEVKKLFEAGSK